MIEITKLNNEQIFINSSLIESVGETPDTTITMINGKKYIVKETVDEIIKKAAEYNRRLRA